MIELIYPKGPLSVHWFKKHCLLKSISVKWAVVDRQKYYILTKSFYHYKETNYTYSYILIMIQVKNTYEVKLIDTVTIEDININEI